jgi:hypothetical protein
MIRRIYHLRTSSGAELYLNGLPQLPRTHWVLCGVIYRYQEFTQYPRKLKSWQQKLRVT